MVAAVWESQDVLASIPDLRMVPPADLAEVDESGRGLDSAVLRLLSLQGIVVPDRPFTLDERQSLALVQEAMRSGRILRAWEELSFWVEPRAARAILEAFAGDSVCGLGLDGEGEALTVFGGTVLLGPERLALLQARLENQREVRAFLGSTPGSTDRVALHFVPDENKIVESAFLRPLRLSPAALAAANLPADRAVRLRGTSGLLSYRPGKWQILVSRPLHVPVEIAPSPITELQGWQLEVPDRVSAGLDQLDSAERAAVLTLLWRLQREDDLTPALEMGFVNDTPSTYRIARPTPDLRVILQLREDNRMEVVEVVHSKTLQMFRER